jgi:hypothetical protein
MINVSIELNAIDLLISFLHITAEPACKVAARLLF